MKKIEIGHLIRVHNKPDNFTFSGVVVDIEDRMENEYLPYVSLKVYDGQNKDACMVCSASANYKESDLTISFIQEVDAAHVEKMKKLYNENHERPDDVKPNTEYSNGIEIYVKTKKAWFTLIRTTAKMAMFDGGRCALTNVTDIRRKS